MWATQVANQATASGQTAATLLSAPAATIFGIPILYVLGGVGVIVAYLALRKKKAPAAA
jgi:Trk-type K+ transport system membrane component